MNVDLLKDNPAWTTYFYIAVPLIIGVLLSVFLLKVVQRHRIVNALYAISHRAPKAMRRWTQNQIRFLTGRRPRRPKSLLSGNREDLEMGIHDPCVVIEGAIINGWDEATKLGLNTLSAEQRKRLFDRILPASLHRIYADGDPDAIREYMVSIVSLVKKLGYKRPPHGRPEDTLGDFSKLIHAAIEVAIKCQLIEVLEHMLEMLMVHMRKGVGPGCS